MNEFNIKDLIPIYNSTKYTPVNNAKTYLNSILNSTQTLLCEFEKINYKDLLLIEYLYKNNSEITELVNRIKENIINNYISDLKLISQVVRQEM